MSRQTGRIALLRDVTPRTRQVRIAAASLIGWDPEPGADLAVLLPVGGAASAERRYSIGDADPLQGSVDLFVVRHGRGPGSRWAERAREGDEVGFVRPSVPAIRPDEAAEAHLLLGDETSIALARAFARSPRGPATTAWFEVSGSEDRWPASELPGVDARFLVRRAPPGAALAEQLEAAPPARRVTAYVTGETRFCTTLVARLVRDLGWPRARVRAFPHWKERPTPA